MGDHIEDEFGNPDTWTIEDTILSLEIFKANLTNDKKWFYDNFERLVNANFRNGNLSIGDYKKYKSGDPDTLIAEDTNFILEMCKANLTHDIRWLDDNFERLVNINFRNGKLNMVEYVKKCWQKVYWELQDYEFIN